MKKTESISFNKDQFKKVLRASRTILIGRRGLSSKKRRVKMKIFRETLSKVVDELCNVIVYEEQE